MSNVAVAVVDSGSAMGSVAIRRAAKADAETLCAAEREIAKTPGRLVSRPEELNVADFSRKIGEMQKTGSYLVAERDGDIVGHAFLELVSPLHRLSHVRQLTIAVHPGCAGQGVGTRLLRALQDWAVDNGIERIELRVRSTNATAVHLYKKCGFIEECTSLRRIKLEDGTYLDDMSMAWFAGGAER